MCDESLILPSIFFSQTDRTKKDIRQMKSDISEKLKTLVSATKEESEFPHIVVRWELTSKITVKN